jgi:hypothetical protein
MTLDEWDKYCQKVAKEVFTLHFCGEGSVTLPANWRTLAKRRKKPESSPVKPKVKEVKPEPVVKYSKKEYVYKGKRSVRRKPEVQSG